MSETKEKIEEVVVTVLEDWAMFFVESTEVSPTMFEGKDKCFVSRLQFKGPVEGSYCVICDNEFMTSLADNVLGGADDLSDSDLRDALGEFANVLCGNMLTEIYGDDPVFDLSPPSVSELKDDNLEQYFNSQTVGCLADDEPVAVTFILDAE